MDDSPRQTMGARWHARSASLACIESRLFDKPFRVAGSLRPAEQRLSKADRRGPAHGAGALDYGAARLDAAQAVQVIETVLDDVDERHRGHVVPQHHGSQA